jgi:hypothetical protein
VRVVGHVTPVQQPVLAQSCRTRKWTGGPVLQDWAGLGVPGELFRVCCTFVRLISLCFTLIAWFRENKPGNAGRSRLPGRAEASIGPRHHGHTMAWHMKRDNGMQYKKRGGMKGNKRMMCTAGTAT